MQRIPIIRRLAPLVAVLALAACTPKPGDYLEAMNWGMVAQSQGDLKAAYANYRTAFEMAAKAGDGARAVFAADLGADAAAALGNTDDAVTLLDAALGTHRKDAATYAGRFRMPNDLAVYKARQKKRAEAKRLLEEALKPYEGKGFSAAYPFAPFATMSRNLALVLAAEGWNADAEAWYDRLAVKITENATVNRNAPHLWTGSGAALRSLAALAKTGPRAAEAAALAEKAAALEAAEKQLAGRASVEGRCYTRDLRGEKQTVCMLDL